MRQLRGLVVCLYVALSSVMVLAQQPVDRKIPGLFFQKEETAETDRSSAPDQKITGSIVLYYREQLVPCTVKFEKKPLSLSEIADLIQEECNRTPGFPQLRTKVSVVERLGEQRLHVEVDEAGPKDHFWIEGYLSPCAPTKDSQNCAPTEDKVGFVKRYRLRLSQCPGPNFESQCPGPGIEPQKDGSLDPGIILQTDDLRLVHLKHQTWLLEPYDNPLVAVRVQQICPRTPTKPDADPKALDPDSYDCMHQFVLQRTENYSGLEILMEVTKGGDLEIYRTRIRDDDTFAVNGGPELGRDNASLSIPNEQNGDNWHIDWYQDPPGCRVYEIRNSKHNHFDLYQPIGPRSTLRGAKSNSIMVGPAKVFDVSLLQQMLSNTAAQLAAISGFNQASIVGAFGNLQGITRDTSFLAAQVTTAPTPQVANTVTNGTTGTMQTVAGSATPTQTASKVTLQCPDGTLPTLSSGNIVGCTVASLTPPTSGTGTVNTNTTTTPGTTTQQTNGNQTNAQNQTVTTTPSVSGTVPTAPASTALAPPTNVGVSSADILTEQVELNAQITSYRLLLQGALSDQYVIRHTRPVGTRQQTTLGFTISLDPPRQYKGAIAEVRIMIVPKDPAVDAYSIVNLLPSEKTYNVAKVTSNQKSFGAGAVVSPVSVGVNTGKSKDRLYLVKETDTVALQYAPPVETLEDLHRRFPQKTHDTAKGIVRLLGANELGRCFDPNQEKQSPSQKDGDSDKAKGNTDQQNGVSTKSTSELDYKGDPNQGKWKLDSQLTVGRNATVFGWQFRPVLGEAYVRPGQRQVFAQLAMPGDLPVETALKAVLYIETRWRDYDQKHQVAGAVYTSSCSVVSNLSGVSDRPILLVKDVDMADLGGGQVRLTAKGQFETSSLNVLAGTVNLVPLTSNVVDSDERLLLTANARDLLSADKLTLYGAAGSPTPFARLQKPDGCRAGLAKLEAIPYPDGNSRMTLTLTMGAKYKPSDIADGQPEPLVLIGSSVYGLRETPFTEDTEVSGYKHCKKPKSADAQSPYVCTYHFIAPTTDVRNAQTFLVKDLRWEDMSWQGKTSFYPSFSSLALLAKPESDDPSSGTTSTTGKSQTKESSRTKKKKVEVDCTNPTSLSQDEKSMCTTVLVSGFDFDRLQASANCEDGRTRSKPVLNVYAGDDTKGYSLIPTSRNLATVILPSDKFTSAKSVRFKLSDGCPHDSNEQGIAFYTVEWDLAVPKAEDASITAKPAALRVSDDIVVTFTGDKLKNVDDQTVTFEGVKPPLVAHLKGSTLTVHVTTAVTGKPGHKELTVVDKSAKDPKDNLIPLPLDVFK